MLRLVARLFLMGKLKIIKLVILRKIREKKQKSLFLLKKITFFIGEVIIVGVRPLRQLRRQLWLEGVERWLLRCGDSCSGSGWRGRRRLYGITGNGNVID